MRFSLTDEQRMIRDTARDFATRVLAPRAAERDRHSTFPDAELAQLGELGLLAVAVPEDYGGSGAGAVAYSLAMQEIAYADPSVAVAVSVTNMVAELITQMGSEEQKRLHVPKLASGAHVCGSFALSEPHAGSNPAALRTTARPSGDGWVLSGTKQWVTSGDRSGVIVVWAVTDPDAGHRGLSAFLVPRGAEGLVVNRAEDKMGLHGSTTVQLGLDAVQVGPEALLGRVGQGFKLAMLALDGGRIGIASQAIGAARFAFDTALRYATEREQFGVPIIEHQAIGNKMADGATAIDAANLMTLRAAWRKENGLPYTREASMAKLFATENAIRICDQAIQVHGGYGYTRDFPVERAYRDVRVTAIYEGTSEIQRLVIARELIKGQSA